MTRKPKIKNLGEGAVAVAYPATLQTVILKKDGKDRLAIVDTLEFRSRAAQKRHMAYV